MHDCVTVRLKIKLYILLSLKNAIRMLGLYLDIIEKPLKGEEEINWKMQIYSFSQYHPEIFTAVISIPRTNREIKLLKILKLF